MEPADIKHSLEKKVNNIAVSQLDLVQTRKNRLLAVKT